MEANTTTYAADGGIRTPTLKTCLSIPMSVFRPPRQSIERLVTDMLNAANGAKDGRHLDGLLRSWADADCNLEKWAVANSARYYGLRKTCEEWRVTPFDGPVPSGGNFRPTLQGAIGLDASAETRDHAEERVAYDTFTGFVLTSGTVVRIGICDRCGKLYWNRWGHANKRFCGRKCSQLQTAIEGQLKRSAKERREKNKRIVKAVREFIEQKPATADWKAWVAKRAAVTLAYLTRSYNRGIRGESDGLKLTERQKQYLELKGKLHGNLQTR